MYIKMGLKGVRFIQACFRDALTELQPKIVLIQIRINAIKHFSLLYGENFMAYIPVLLDKRNMNIII